jgi:hypothetical protein
MKFALLFLLHMLTPVVGAVFITAGMRWLGVDTGDASAIGMLAFLLLGFASAATAMDRSNR